MKKMALTFSLMFFVVLFSHAQDSLQGAMEFHKAEMILRDYDKAGRPQTKEGKQQLQNALEHINKALGLAPSDAGLWFKKALFQQMYLNDNQEAFSALQKSYALSQRPETADKLTEVAIELGEYEEAILISNQIVRNTPSHDKTTLLFTTKLVIAHLLNGNAIQAKQSAEQLIEHDHSMFSKALTTLARAVADGGYPQPSNVQDFREEISGLYQIVLEQDPILKSLEGGPWSIQYENENQQEYIREYFQPGESPKNWNQKVVYQLLKGSTEAPKDYLAGLKKFVKSSCEKPHWKSLKIADSTKENPAVAASWTEEKACPSLNYHFEVTKVVQLNDQLLARIAFVSRTKNSDKLWVDFITDLPLRAVLSGQNRQR